MHNLVDLIQMKNPSLNRDNIEQTLSIATECVLESLSDGKGVKWVGFGTFTWKKKAATKKAAALWKEYPYLDEGDKARFVPEEEGIKLVGEVSRMKRELPQEVKDAIQQS